VPAGTLSVADAMSVPLNAPAVMTGGVAALHVTVFRTGLLEKAYHVILVSVEGSSTDVNSGHLERNK